MYTQPAGIDPHSMDFDSEREDKLRQEWLLELARRLEFAGEEDTFEAFTGLRETKRTSDAKNKREWSGDKNDTNMCSPEKKRRSLGSSHGSVEEKTCDGSTAAQDACWEVLAYILDPLQCTLRTDGADTDVDVVPLKAFWHGFRHLCKHDGAESDNVETLHAWRALMALCTVDLDKDLNVVSPGSPTVSPLRPRVLRAEQLRDAESAVRLLLGVLLEIERERHEEESAGKERHEARHDEESNPERREEERPVQRMAEIYYGRFMADKPPSFTPVRHAIMFALMHPECWTLEDVLDLVGMSPPDTRHNVKGTRAKKKHARLFFKAFDLCVLSCKDHEKCMVRVLSAAAKKVLSKNNDDQLTAEDKEEIARRIQKCAMRYVDLVRAHAPEGDDAHENFDVASIQAQKSLLFAFSNPRVFKLSSLGFLIDMNDMQFWD
eukprot:GEMP01006717.1.p1 GENE.GEMP01006717.1~~GEMP01006717.1.p1  ORF type:complete len:435 (+),score=128.98 GEMP01006717.1:277-1581(+)